MIQARDLRFRYPGAPADTLHGIDLSVTAGEVVGLLGPSGAGKSTTVGVLTGALTGLTGRVGGEVHVLGEPGPPDRRRLARIGVGFEVPSVYLRLTARENLALFAALHRVPTPDVEALLARVGLDGQADQRVDRFSKGMRSRLDLCRALVADPELLFLDEPTAALDPGYARQVRTLVRGFADRGGAVLLTTHDMHVAEAICDRVALIVDGRVVACDTPRALRLAGSRPEDREVRLEVEEAGEVAVRSVTMAALGADPAVHACFRDGRVRAVHSCEPTLEDVFIRLTGRQLRGVA